MMFRLQRVLLTVFRKDEKSETVLKSTSKNGKRADNVTCSLCIGDLIPIEVFFKNKQTSI